MKLIALGLLAAMLLMLWRLLRASEPKTAKLVIGAPAPQMLATLRLSKPPGVNLA